MAQKEIFDPSRICFLIVFFDFYMFTGFKSSAVGFGDEFETVFLWYPYVPSCQTSIVFYGAKILTQKLTVYPGLSSLVDPVDFGSSYYWNAHPVDAHSCGFEFEERYFFSVFQI